MIKENNICTVSYTNCQDEIPTLVCQDSNWTKIINMVVSKLGVESYQDLGFYEPDYRLLENCGNYIKLIFDKDYHEYEESYDGFTIITITKDEDKYILVDYPGYNLMIFIDYFKTYNYLINSIEISVNKNNQNQSNNFILADWSNPSYLVFIYNNPNSPSQFKITLVCKKTDNLKVDILFDLPEGGLDINSQLARDLFKVCNNITEESPTKELIIKNLTLLNK